MLRDLVLANRTYRRFYEDIKIEREVLEDLIDLARLSSSGANLQPLKYILSYSEESNNFIFPNLKWAGYLKDWDGPSVGERPTAYIVMLLDKNISKNPMWDHGIACQSILLGAAEKGLGGCMFGSVDRAEVAKAFNIPENLEVLLVIALGKPKEEIVLEDIKDPKDVKYWRDENQVHHVPKRKLEDLLIN
ncbi:nitroreductase family protein [Clostridium thermarum]|uniref:nitroreductase family protein n=1 Tax=Clostridium thermarum TaxID=1716543 RepID=UPI0011202062|nr:nitroreductase family protein [Clostridium thermarum]